MGGNSSSTRKITLVNDEASGVIKISDSVVKRLKGELESEASTRAPQKSSENDPPKHPNLAHFPEPARIEPRTLPPAAFARGGANFFEEQRLRAIQQEKEDEIRKLDSRWRNRLTSIEQQNEELEKRMKSAFTAKVNEVATAFPTRSYEPICKDKEQEVLECYLANPTTSLNCSQVVREFSNCVQQARMARIRS